MMAPIPKAYAEATQYDTDPNSGIMLSYLHLNELTYQYPLEISQPFAIHYPRGMYPVMEDFAFAVRHIHVGIKSVSYEHAELDIEFEMLWPRKEINLWVALDEVRHESRNRCCSCSKLAPRKIRLNRLRAICDICYYRELRNALLIEQGDPNGIY